MKRFLTLLAFVAIAISSFAHDVKVDGIYYNLIPKLKEATVTYSGASAHQSYFRSVTIPETIIVDEVTYSVTSIGESAFAFCSGMTPLTSVTIPNSVTSIGEFAFESCYGLTSITIPNSVTSIGYQAFGYCYGLTSVTIPNSVTSIGEFAFFSCSKLTSVTIPNSVTSIGRSAFMDCEKLTSVTIPNSVTSIGYQAFMGCSSLTSITIPNSVTSIERSAFSNCSRLTSITIPNFVTSIESNTFSNCSRLTSVTIPNSVMSIGSSAFSNCSGLTSVTIGKSVKYIYSGAFANCNNLETVTCLAESLPSADTNAFEESYVNYSTLVVPEALIQQYQTTAPWKEFGTFKTLEGGDTPETKKCEAPTIDYIDGHLKFSSTTPNATYSYTLTDNDIKTSLTKSTTGDIPLSTTYNITVYAEAEGYETSDATTKTLQFGGNSGTEDVDALKEQIKSLQTQNSALESENATLKETIKKYAEGDLNLDGRTDIDDVVYLLKIDSYSSDTDALALLLDGATAITLSDINNRFGDVEFYSLNGVKVDIPNQTGIYIVKKNGETKMVVVKK